MAHFLDSKALESKATTLTLNNEEWSSLQWIEKDHEFIFEGKLYDIVSIQQQDGHMQIRCVEDEREASLFKTMGKLVTHDQSESNGEHTLILSVFKFLSTLVLQFYVFPTHGDMASIRPMDAYINHYNFIFHSFPIQPPKQVSFSFG